jgi:hypothetical protein
MKRGRPSASDRSLVVHFGRPPPPEPPAELTEAQAAIWRSTVTSLPGDWIERGGLSILVEFTRRVVRSQQLEQQIREFDPEWINNHAGGLERFDRLLAMADRETKAVISCARALRLTPQSQVHPRVAGRRLANTPIGPAPWDGCS